MGFLSFSSWWGGELQIYDDRTLIRFFSGGGKLRMFKRGNKEILQCSLLRVKYIWLFFSFLFFQLHPCIWAILCSICTEQLHPDVWSFLFTAV